MTQRADDEPPVSARVLDAAIAWQLKLDAGDPADGAAHCAWLAAHPDHARAWRQLALIDAEIGVLSPYPPLSAALRRPRRTPGWKRAAGLTALAAVTLLGALLADRYQPLDGLLADYRTGTGQRRTVALPDRSVVVLNARSVVDLAFDARTRTLRLRSGEIHVETASDAALSGDRRPFVVSTAHGALYALGTRFMVRHDEDATWLTVTHAAVLARPASCPAARDTACAGERRAEAGQTLRMTQTAVGPVTRARADGDAWKDGMLVVDGEPLSAVVAELARYRPGLLQVAPEVAALRVTGALPLDDGERALAALSASLPIRIVRRSDWWVRIEAEDRRQRTEDREEISNQ
jgi:transmembrane sensor